MTITDFTILRKVHTYETKTFGFKIEIAFKGWDRDLDEFVFCGTYSNPSRTFKRSWYLSARQFVERLRSGKYIPVK